LAASGNQSDDSFGQILWKVIIDPKGNYGKLRNDVVISRVMAGVSSAAVTAVVGVVCTCTERKSEDDQIAEQRWEQLDPAQKARFTFEHMDIGLLLKRYDKGLFASSLSALIRLVVAHLFPCYVILRICSGEESPGWFSSVFQWYIYFYYSLYGILAFFLFVWSALCERLSFCSTFVLPFSGAVIVSEVPDRMSERLWHAAQTNAVLNLVSTIVILIIWAPQLICLGASIALRKRSSVLPVWAVSQKAIGYFFVFLLVMDVTVAILALLGLIVSVIRHTPTFWFLVSLFTTVPGLLGYIIWITL